MDQSEALYLVWFGVSNILQQILKETGSLMAYSELCLDTQNGFLQISEESISRQLTMNIAKLFDNASTCGNTNCSIRFLRELCINRKDVFVNGADDITICKIDDSINRFEEVISREIRNKKLAHFDFDELYLFRQTYISFDDIIEIVNGVIVIVEELGNRLEFLSVEYPPITKYAEYFKKELIKLQHKEC